MSFQNGLRIKGYSLTKHKKWDNFVIIMDMKNKKTYIKPEIVDLGEAKHIIKGLTLGKETGGADGLFDDNDNPVSIPD